MRQGTDYPPNVHIFQVAVLADEVEDELLRFLVVQPLAILVGCVVRFLQDGIENEFPLFDASTGKPFDLHEELGTEAQQGLFRNHFLLLSNQGSHQAVP